MTLSEQAAERARHWLELVNAFGAAETGTPEKLAKDVLALTARVAEMERERESWLGQRWSYQNRAEVAERGHKACLARAQDREAELASQKRRAEQLAEALRATEQALTLWERAVGEINVYPTTVRKALALARDVLAASGAEAGDAEETA